MIGRVPIAHRPVVGCDLVDLGGQRPRNKVWLKQEPEGSGTMRRPVRIAIVRIKLDGGSRAGREGRHSGSPNAWVAAAEGAAQSAHHRFKPRLNDDRFARLECKRHVIERLREALIGSLGREHVRDVVQIDVLDEITGQTTDVTHLQ